MDYASQLDPLKSTSAQILDGLDEDLALWCRQRKNIVGDLSDIDAIYRVLTALAESLLYDSPGPAHLVIRRLKDDNADRADGGADDDGLNAAILSTPGIIKSW